MPTKPYRPLFVLSILYKHALAQDGSSTASRTIAGAVLGVFLGVLVLTFASIVVKRHCRVYGSPTLPTIELRRVSSYVSVFTRRQNSELGASDEGPGYSAPPYTSQPPPYTGTDDAKEQARIEALGVPKQADVVISGLGYDVTPLPAKDGVHVETVDVVDTQGRYDYDIPPPSPSTSTSSGTPPPPPTPPAAHFGPFDKHYS